MSDILNRIANVIDQWKAWGSEPDPTEVLREAGDVIAAERALADDLAAAYTRLYVAFLAGALSGDLIDEHRSCQARWREARNPHNAYHDPDAAFDSLDRGTDG